MNNVNNKSFNELSKIFSELEQHSINLELALQQNLKVQLQEKDNTISELKKLIEKMKGKFVETKFEKPLVIRQPNAFKSQRQSVLDNSIHRKSASYICDLKGNDLLKGSRGTDLYSITLQDTSTPNPICLMAKTSSSQAWLWHRRLSHLNFATFNLLSKYDIVSGLPKLKFVKDHLFSSCDLG
ncbi:retrovirus-related pol polyprotein from transposon TNT 1-94 [Tanacetum coccineum]